MGHFLLRPQRLYTGTLVVVTHQLAVGGSAGQGECEVPWRTVTFIFTWRKKNPEEKRDVKNPKITLAELPF